MFAMTMHLGGGGASSHLPVEEVRLPQHRSFRDWWPKKDEKVKKRKPTHQDRPSEVIIWN